MHEHPNRMKGWIFWFVVLHGAPFYTVLLIEVLAHGFCQNEGIEFYTDSLMIICIMAPHGNGVVFSHERTYTDKCVEKSKKVSWIWNVILLAVYLFFVLYNV